MKRKSKTLKKKTPKRHKQTYWEQLLPKRKATKRKVKRRVKAMARKTKAETEANTEPALHEEEIAPPPAPPKVESPPTEPCAPDAVKSEDQVGADPENPNVVHELDLIPEATRGEGPKPEGTEPPPPQAADKGEGKE
jgi:hypothetical protein